jgi:hypothetical protein
MSTGNTQQIINYGAQANDGTGDPLRDAFIKTDDNFSNIWAAGPVGSNITIANNAIQVNDTNGNLVLKPNGIGEIQVRASIVPDLDQTRDLGSTDRRFRSIYFDGSIDTSGNLVAGNLAVSGDVVIDGNLTVNGNVIDPVIIGNLEITGQRIIISRDATTAEEADLSGIIINGANARITYLSEFDSISINKNLFLIGNTFSANAIAANVLQASTIQASAIQATDVITPQISFPFPIDITSNNFTWQFAGNIMRAPEGGTWQSSADTIYLTSPDNGYITLESRVDGNTVSELFMEHSFIRFFIDNGIDATWQMLADGRTQFPSYVFPYAAGNTGEILKIDATGNLFWTTDSSDYGNANVATFLASFGSNTISTTGNIAGNYFIGNIEGLTGNITNLVSLNFDVENISARGNAGVNIGAGGFNNLVVLETGVLVQNVPLSVAGNVTANYFLGNGSQLTGISASSISNGTSNVAIATANGNVTVSADTQTWKFGTDSNLTVAGNINFGGDPSAAPSLNDFASITSAANFAVTINSANSVSTWSFATGDSALGEFDELPLLRTPAGDGSVIYNETLMAILAGNIDAGERSSVRLQEGAVVLLGTTSLDGELSTIILDVNTGGVVIRALGDAAPRLSVVGNVTGGNILTNGLISATGNVTGGNIITAGQVVATGNINAGQIILINGAVIKDTTGNAVAIGVNAGVNTQGNRAVAIGLQAGETSQGVSGVAIGEQAGHTSQGVLSVAIGYYAGANAQSFSAVAIGAQAGETAQGSGAIAIGDLAGRTNQASNSIIINATGANLDQTTANTFTVAPVRNDVANVGEVMFYNTTSKEITYGNTISVAGNVSATRLQNDANLEIRSNVAGTAKIWTFDTLGDLNMPVGGNISGSGLITGARISVTGNIEAGNIEAGYVYGDSLEGNVLTAGTANVSGNISTTTGVYANVDVVVGDVANASATKTRFVTEPGFSYIQTGNGTVGSTGNIVFSPYSDPTQRVVIDTSSGNVTAGNITLTGNVVSGSAANITFEAGAYTMTFDTTGNLSTSGTNGNITGAYVVSAAVVRTVPTTVSLLPLANVVGAGSRAFVTDANTATFGTTITGGAANAVPVYSDGTNWRVG